MIRLSLLRWLVVLVVVASATARVDAVIKTPLALKAVLNMSVDVLEARVVTVDKKKGRVIFEWSRDVKGRTKIAKFAVTVASKVKKDFERLDKRLRSGVPVVVFISKGGKSTRFLFFSEGTWFSSTYVSGMKPGERPREQAKPKDTTGTSFSACEIYLRRTYAGTTKDLLALLPDVIKGKRKSPKWNGKIKPGLGPELPPPKKTKTDSKKKGPKKSPQEKVPTKKDNAKTDASER
jgi:hypothetical protein